MDPMQKMAAVFVLLCLLKLAGLASLEIKFSFEFCTEGREWFGQFLFKQRNINPQVMLLALSL